MNEKVKVTIELDKQYIREVMLAIGITAADPAKANEILESMGDEISIDLGLMTDSKAEEAQVKMAFAAAAIATAVKRTETNNE